MNAPIRRAGDADLDAVAGLIGIAFHDLDVARWLVPDGDERARILPANFAIYVGHALKYGEIDIIDDEDGQGAFAAAVWFDRTTEDFPPPEDYDERLAAACGERLPRFHQLDTAFEANHPHEVHHHLGFLAVHPDRQDHGLGSALLRHHHQRLDAEGVPGYLEASSARSRDLYLRHGYRVDAPFHLPDDGPPLWPMWRDPRGD